MEKKLIKFKVSAMNTRPSMIIILLSFFVAIQLLAVESIKPGYDFFFFVQHWPGAECDTKEGCCYSKSGKPAADFGIHGLWPEYDDGTGGYPTKCDPKNKNPYDPSKIKDLIPSLEKNWPSLACPSGDPSKIWAHEWVKHGTCSLATLSQHGYFNAALKLKAKVNLLQILAKQKIQPDGNFYELGKLRDVLTDGIGFVPGIDCNMDKSKNSQLYQVLICVDKSGSNFINCPVYPRIKNCNKKIKFPSFGKNSKNEL